MQQRAIIYSETIRPSYFPHWKRWHFYNEPDDYAESPKNALNPFNTAMEILQRQGCLGAFRLIWMINWLAKRKAAYIKRQLSKCHKGMHGIRKTAHIKSAVILCCLADPFRSQWQRLQRFVCKQSSINRALALSIRPDIELCYDLSGHIRFSHSPLVLSPFVISYTYTAAPINTTLFLLFDFFFASFRYVCVCLFLLCQWHSTVIHAKVSCTIFVVLWSQQSPPVVPYRWRCRCSAYVTAEIVIYGTDIISTSEPPAPLRAIAASHPPFASFDRLTSPVVIGA